MNDSRRLCRRGKDDSNRPGGCLSKGKIGKYSDGIPTFASVNLMVLVQVVVEAEMQVILPPRTALPPGKGAPCNMSRSFSWVATSSAEYHRTLLATG